MSALWQRLQRWLFVDVDAAVYGLLRLFFGLSGVCKFTGMTSPLPRLIKGGFELGFPRHRYGGNSFAPGVFPAEWGGPLLQPSLETYRAVETAALWLAIVVVVGLGSRVVTLLFAACCWWLLLVDPTGFKHNLFALAMFGLLIGCSPCGDRCSVDAVLLRRLRGPGPAPVRTAFSLRFIQIQMAVVYLFSTLAKLNDGWASGHLLAGGITKNAARAAAAGLDWLVPIISFRPFYGLASCLIVAVEGFLVFAFFVPRLRVWALFVGVVLHTGIDISIDVGSYSLTMFAVYLAFVTPTPRQHRLYGPRWLSRLVRALDWFCRFDVVVGAPLRLEGPRGAELRRGRIARELLLRLPLTFVPAFAIDRAARWWRRRRRPSTTTSLAV